MTRALSYLLCLFCMLTLLSPILVEAQNRWGEEEELPFGVTAKLGGSKLNHGGTSIGGIGFAANGQLVSCAGDQYVRYWDKVSGDETGNLPGAVETPYTIMTVSPIGNRAVVYAKGHTKPIQTWDLQAKNIMASYGTIEDGGNLPITNDGKYVITFNGTKINVWESGSGTLLKAFPGTKAEVGYALFFPGAETRFATLDKNGSHLRIYDWTNGREIQALKLKHPASLMAFDTKGDTLYLATEKGVQLVTTRSLNKPGARGSASLTTLWGSVKTPVLAMTSAPDGKTLAISSRPGKIYLLNPMDGKVKSEIDTPGNESHLVIDPSGKYLISAGLGGGMRLWALHQDNRLVHKPKGHSGPITAARFSQDKSKLLTASLDGSAKVWSTADGTFQANMTHGGPVYSALWSKDNSSILTGSEDGVRLFSKDGKLTWFHEIPKSTKVEAAFTKDGQIVAVNNSAIYMLDMNGKVTKTIKHATQEVKNADGTQTTMQNPAPVIQGPNFMLSPTGNVVMVQNLNKSATYFIEIPSGKEIGSIKTPAPENQALAWSEGGEFMVEVLPDKFTLKDFKGRDRIGRPRGPEESPFYVGGLSHDGYTLAVGISEGNSIWTWNLQTGEEGDELEGHRARITGIYYSQDKSMMASASSDGIVLIRELD